MLKIVGEATVQVHALTWPLPGSIAFLTIQSPLPPSALSSQYLSKSSAHMGHVSNPAVHGVAVHVEISGSSGTPPPILPPGLPLISSGSTWPSHACTPLYHPREEAASSLSRFSSNTESLCACSSSVVWKRRPVSVQYSLKRKCRVSTIMSIGRDSIPSKEHTSANFAAAPTGTDTAWGRICWVASIIPLPSIGSIACDCVLIGRFATGPCIAAPNGRCVLCITDPTNGRKTGALCSCPIKPGITPICPCKGTCSCPCIGFGMRSGLFNICPLCICPTRMASGCICAIVFGN